METNASNFIIKAYLAQLDKNGKLYPVAYHLKKITALELNYKIHNKELLAIIDAYWE